MQRTRRQLTGWLRTALAVAFVMPFVEWCGFAHAYVPDQRWSTTASGPGGANGDPLTLTWSLARDGTSIPNEGASNLISYLDAQIGAGPGGTDYTQRPWFSLIEDSFQRWSTLSGLTFAYEPNDSGPLSGAGGVLGVRGDIRIGGAVIDGSSGTLAYTYLPNDGDMVVDSGESTFFGDSSNNYRAFRNTIMHEIGHAFGLLHIESSSDRLLMEPVIDLTFDGPQLDDVRGAQGLYGDALEKTFGGQGNDVASRASGLGTLAVGGSLAIGATARGTQSVGAAETDFVSIANSADVDYFSFTTTAPALVDLTLTPLGGVFQQGTEGGVQSSFNANARNNLALALYGADGTTLLDTANSAIAGGLESLSDVALLTPGKFFVRVSGADANVQLYELALSASVAVAAPTADFDGSGSVDGRDLLLWQRTLGQSGAGLGADGNHDGVVNQLDLALWRQDFGAGAVSEVALASVPEPTSLASFFALIFGFALLRFTRPIARRHR